MNKINFICKKCKTGWANVDVNITMDDKWSKIVLVFRCQDKKCRQPHRFVLKGELIDDN